MTLEKLQSGLRETLNTSSDDGPDTQRTILTRFRSPEAQSGSDTESFIYTQVNAAHGTGRVWTIVWDEEAEPAEPEQVTWVMKV